MAFAPGVSGNPAGRPSGLASAAKLRAAIEGEIPAILKAMVEAALSGDVQAQKTLIDKCLPNVRPIDLAVTLPPLPDNLGDAGRDILAAVARGDITPLQGQQLLSGLGAVTRAIEVDEIMRRLDVLEANGNVTDQGTA